MSEVVEEALQYNISPGEFNVILINGLWSDIPKDSETCRYFTVSSWFIASNFILEKRYNGPFEVSLVVRFIETIKDEIKNNPGKQICLVIKADSEYSLNALLLSGIYLMLEKGHSSSEASEKIMHIIKKLCVRHYRSGWWFDMGEEKHLTISLCLEALTKFRSLGLFDHNAFYAEDTLISDYAKNANMNWIIPNKILALAGPVSRIREFIYYAKAMNITHMVRLNDKHYDATLLNPHDIKHIDLFIHDCRVPTIKEVEEFYEIANEAWEKGAIAVHCYAGLGRTGTIIATFLIKKFKVQAVEAVAFLRMMRPGSVFGSQTRFLEKIQYYLRGESDQLPPICPYSKNFV